MVASGGAIGNVNRPGTVLRSGLRGHLYELEIEFTKAGERIQQDARNVRDRFKHGNEHIVKRTSHVAKLFGKLIGIGMVGLSFLWLIFFTLTVTGTVDFIPVTGDSEYTSFHDFMQLVASMSRSSD